jgi:hypothetical protein
MISDREIWMAAKAMIARYGSNAGLEAAERADEQLEQGDHEGSATWQRILAAIEKLQAEKPEPGERAQHWTKVQYERWRTRIMLDDAHRSRSSPMRTTPHRPSWRQSIPVRIVARA